MVPSYRCETLKFSVQRNRKQIDNSGDMATVEDIAVPFSLPAINVPKRGDYERGGDVASIPIDKDPVVEIKEIPLGGALDGEESIEEVLCNASDDSYTNNGEKVCEGVVDAGSAPEDSSLGIAMPAIPRNQHNQDPDRIASFESKSFTRSGHRIKSSTRRSDAFMPTHWHHSPLDFTAKAESQFLSLIECMSSASDFMSNASRQASSLKAFWQEMIMERECFYRERAEFEERYDEVTERIEQYKHEITKRNCDTDEHKKSVDKLRLELSLAMSATSAEKEKVIIRERELARLRHELHGSAERVTHLSSKNQELSQSSESQRLLLEETRSERDSYKCDAEKHERELSRVVRQKIEISTSLTTVTAKYETSHRDVCVLRDRVKELESQCDEHLHESKFLREEYERMKKKAEETSMQLFNLTEVHEQVQRELTKSKETIKEVESQRDSHCHTISHLQHEIKTISESREEVIKKCSEITLKWEHCKRSLACAKDRIRELELIHKETSVQIETLRIEYTQIVTERNEIKEDLHNAHKHAEESKRRVHILEESLRKSESSLTEVQSQLAMVQDRVKSLICERDESYSKNEMYIVEIGKLREAAVRLQVEITMATETCNKYREQLEVMREEYVETHESQRHSETHGFELEIDCLRKSLRETRAEKEVAVAARKAADRERDEQAVKYEEKCREVERLEDYHHHSHGHRHLGDIGRKVSSGVKSRVVSRAGTTVHGSY